MCMALNDDEDLHENNDRSYLSTVVLHSGDGAAPIISTH